MWFINYWFFVLLSARAFYAEETINDLFYYYLIISLSVFYIAFIAVTYFDNQHNKYLTIECGVDFTRLRLINKFIIYTMVVVVPYLIYFIKSNVNSAVFVEMIQEIRILSVEDNLKQPFIISFMYVLVYISTAISLYCLKFNHISKGTVFVVFSLAVIYGIAFGAKSSLVKYFLFVLCFLFLVDGKIDIRKTLFFAFLFLCLFYFISVSRGSDGVESDGIVIENLLAVLNKVCFYFFSGIYAFDKYLNDPSQVRFGWDMFLVLTNIFDKSVQNVGVNASFVTVLDYQVTNVYTYLFSAYYKYGVLGIVAQSIIFGILAGFFNLEKNMSLLKLTGLSLVLSSLLLSVFNDSILQNMIFYIKTIFVAVIIVRLTLKNECF